VVAYLALFVALGGTTYAAATIGSGNIKNDAVLSRHIKDGAVKNPDLGANSVGTGKVIDGSLLAQDFKAGQLPKGDKGNPCLSSDPACKGPKGDNGNPCLSSDPACKGPKGDTGARGPSDAFTNYGSAHTISNGSTQTVASVTLPAGHYTLSASVSFDEADADGEQTALSCSFVSAGTIHQMQIGGYSGAYGVTNPQETMPVVGDGTMPVNRFGGTSIFLRCKSVLKSANVRAGMVATRVGTITPSS
jgi:hypothetical protein